MFKIDLLSNLLKMCKKNLNIILQTIDVLTKVNPINLDRSGTTDVTMNVSVKTVQLDITCATIGILNMASTSNINF